MLQLKNIIKRYEAGEFSVDALKGISLDFRKSEFVSILGPSGCGKTTLLNIMGGLDKYTSGDLIINGKSTKNFSDRDWDAYRNHSVGFVFQSYNLIPHQTVLQNVELALALSGVGHAERVERAKEALDKVGLKNMYHKRPSEMSGGQMQRVAIARAIVNNPDIILADEPTGALDSETSVQVMDILKEISADRLVVMVTHNPELAQKYSTRIVRMLDGKLEEDSAPLSGKEIADEKASDEKLLKQSAEDKQRKKSKKRVKKPKMSFGTSFMLSLKNLFTKRGRTMLTSFAGSIGIIGIALIFAVSQGTSGYIDAVQEDTLSSYPLTLRQTNTDLSSMLSLFAASAESDPHDNDAVYEKMVLYSLTNALSDIESSENDLKSYKEHLEAELADPESELSQALNGVHYSYNLDLQIYTKYEGDDASESDEVMIADTSDVLTEMVSLMYGVDMSSVESTGTGVLSSLFQSGSSSTVWEELLPAADGGSVNQLLKDQYDLVAGSWPSSGSEGKNQIVLVVDSDNEISDMTLYALGLIPRAEIEAVIEAAQNGESAPSTTQRSWTYEEIFAKKYKTIFPFECYEQNADGTWSDKREVDGSNPLQISVLKEMYESYDYGLELEIVGIIRPNESASSHMLSGTICYTHELTKYVIEQANESEIGKAQKENPDIDIFTGKYFKTNNLSTESKAEIFRDYIENATVEERAEAFLAINTIPTQTEIDQMQAYLESLAENDETTFKNLLLQMMQSSGSTTSSSVEEYIMNADAETLLGMISSVVPTMAKAQKRQTYLETYTEEQMASQMYDAVFGSDGLDGYTDARCEMYFDYVIQFSDSTYEDNLATLGCLDLAEPTLISLYAVSFAAKQVIEDDIAAYNEGVPQKQQIEYTDYVGLIMTGITTILNAITYVLIAFVSISLIVSSIMIGVITLISVQERTKEIGILRAIGASKRNVSGMFNAETLIIGFASGLFGVLVTYLLCVVVNVILHSLTGIMTLSAVLPIGAAFVLILISMALTLIAGIIPSRSAAKKNPVVALRTE